MYIKYAMPSKYIRRSFKELIYYKKLQFSIIKRYTDSRWIFIVNSAELKNIEFTRLISNFYI